jgi:hypothetical protein
VRRVVRLYPKYQMGSKIERDGDGESWLPTLEICKKCCVEDSKLEEKSASR